MTKLFLQFFADGAAAADGVATGSEGTQADTSIKSESSQRSRGKKGELSDVVYGIQEETTPESAEGSDAENTEDAATASNEPADRHKTFEELINGEYKEEFTKRTQSIIDRRFKETKNLEAQLKEVRPVLELLMDKYKITDGNLSNLTKAIESDDSYWEEAAEEAGLSVEQYKTVQKLERENRAFRLARQQQERDQFARNQIAQWEKQAVELQQIYPDFDFDAECRNNDFIGLLKAGLPVQKAYETMHLDELVTGAARVAAQKAEQQVVNNIRNKASRPAENGTSSQSSATIKSNVSALTKADRAEIARRVAKGEVIKW